MTERKENGSYADGTGIDADRRALGTRIESADDARRQGRGRSGLIPEVPQEKVVICCPSNYADIEKMIDLMRCRAQVIVDFQGMAKESADKALNILSGAVYALYGGIRRLKGQMFLLTPYGTEIKKGV
jgi:cell division inhibitor SepF